MHQPPCVSTKSSDQSPLTTSPLFLQVVQDRVEEMSALIAGEEDEQAVAEAQDLADLDALTNLPVDFGGP